MDYYTLINIFDYLETKDLIYLSKFRDDIREYVYYRCVSDKVLLKGIEFLQTFEASIPPTVQLVFDYVKTRPYLCISGGFITQLFLGCEIDPTSDIDIYCLDSYCNLEHLEMKRWIESFDNVEITRTGNSNSVWNIDGIIDRTIQLIFVKYDTPTEVIMSFDNSHNRCFYSEGNFYTTFDAINAKNTKTTYFYKTIKSKRAMKAEKLGFTITGLDHTKINPDRETPRKYKQPFPKHIVRMKSWTDYSGSNIIWNPIKLNVLEFETYKDRLEVEANSNFVYLLPTHHFYLKVRIPIEFYVDVVGYAGSWETRGLHSDKQSNCDIIFIKDKLFLVKLKQTMIKLGLKLNNADKLPEKIKQCKDIVGWNDFSKVPQKKYEGYEYHDRIKDYGIGVVKCYKNSLETKYHIKITIKKTYNPKETIHTWFNARYYVE